MTSGSTQPVTYKFDIIAVATIDITTAAGPDKARAAVNSLQAIDNGWDGSLPTDATWELTCVAPRGVAYLVQTDPELPDPDDDDCALEDPEIPQPITGVYLSPDLIAGMHAGLTRLDEAADSTSDNDEHAAARDCADNLARLLRLIGHPYDPEEDPS
jgi:hypothetical protein